MKVTEKQIEKIKRIEKVLRSIQESSKEEQRYSNNLYRRLASQSTQMIARNIDSLVLHHRYAASPYHVRGIPLSIHSIANIPVAHCSLCNRKYIKSSMLEDDGKTSHDIPDYMKRLCGAKDVISENDVFYDRKGDPYIPRMPHMVYGIELDNRAIFRDMPQSTSAIYEFYNARYVHDSLCFDAKGPSILQVSLSEFLERNGFPRFSKFKDVRELSIGIITQEMITGYKRLEHSLDREIDYFHIIYENMMYALKHFMKNQRGFNNESQSQSQYAVSGCLCELCFCSLTDFLLCNMMDRISDMADFISRNEDILEDGNNERNRKKKDKDARSSYKSDYSFLGTKLRFNEKRNTTRSSIKHAFGFAFDYNMEYDSNRNDAYVQYSDTFEHLAPYNISDYFVDFYNAENNRDMYKSFIDMVNVLYSFLKPYIGEDGIVDGKYAFEGRIDRLLERNRKIQYAKNSVYKKK